MDASSMDTTFDGGEIQRLQEESRLRIERGLDESRKLVAALNAPDPDAWLRRELDRDLQRRVEDLATVANICIDEHDRAGKEYAQLCQMEMELEAGRATMKLDAIRRIMQTENALTGKPHSASSADAAVTSDPEYHAYLVQISLVVREKNNEHTKATTAKLRAQLALAQLKATAGVL